MRIALASDHVGLELKSCLMERLKELRHECRDFGAYTAQRCNYPEYGFAAAQAVASGEYDRAVICCGTGVGISLAANKVHGVRCVVCSEPYSAVLSRRHNDTNALALGGRVVGKDLALMILELWLAEPFEGGRHAERVKQLCEIENGAFTSTPAWEQAKNKKGENLK